MLFQLLMVGADLALGAPFAALEGDGVYQRAAQPGHKKGGEKAGGVAVGIVGAAAEIGEEICQRHADDDGGEEGYPHGGRRVAGAAHSARKALGDGEGDISGGDDGHHLDAHVDKCRRVGKEAHQCAAEEQYAGHQHGGRADGQLEAGLYALLDPVEPAGADILAGICGHRVAEAEVGHHNKAVYPHDHGVAGHKDGAEGVGQGLDDQGGGRHDGLSQTRGQAQLDKLEGI